MKTKYSSDKLFFSVRPCIHGNVLARNEPASKSETSKQATENIQRWEDDGGPVTEMRTPLGQVAERNTARRR
jgi:hypothetical protein